MIKIGKKKKKKLNRNAMHSTIGPTKFLQNKNPRIKIVELMEKKK
jgi:hypothetical protein